MIIGYTGGYAQGLIIGAPCSRWNKLNHTSFLFIIDIFISFFIFHIHFSYSFIFIITLFIILFCVISQFWESFSEHAREIFEEACPGLGLPGGGTAFDYYVDLKEAKFGEWSTIVPSFEYNGSVPYFSLMVPTSDTCRFSYVMKSLITVEIFNISYVLMT